MRGTISLLLMSRISGGSSAARPALLLYLCAGALAAALGVASLQVRSARSLDTPRRLAGTPLLVRAPRGWIEPRPGVFVPKPAAGRAEQQPVKLAWRLEFYYERREAFLAPAHLLKDSAAAIPTRIGGLAGLEVHRREPVRTGGWLAMRETIVRLACSPRGDVIMVEYWPPAGFTQSDAMLLDAICDAVRIEGLDTAAGAEPALQRAGLRFAVAEAWRVYPTSPELRPGLYVLSSIRGIPLWSLGVFRTWLAPGRTPRELLSSFAVRAWDLGLRGLPIVEWSPRAGVQCAEVRHPSFAADEIAIPAAWVVASAPDQAAMLFVYAAPRDAAAAAEAARTLADTVELVPEAALDMPAGQAAGRELAELLTREGPYPSWGDAPPAGLYVADSGQRRLVALDLREPIRADGRAGYRGHWGYLIAPEGLYDVASWEINRRATVYQLVRVRGDSRRSQRGSSVTIRERRGLDGEKLRVAVERGGRMAEVREFDVGPTFVAPPLETLAAAWVSGQARGTWLIEVSSQGGGDSFTRLLQPLAHDADGRPRVLSADDFWPPGDVIRFDQDGLPHEWSLPGAVAQRRKPEDAGEYRAAIQRLRSLFPE